ncbi:hypothetical protein Hte_011418 [Hypoxylon texense]
MDKAGLIPHTYTMPMCTKCYEDITGEVAPENRWLNYGDGLVACIRCWQRIDFREVWGVPGLVIIDDVNAPYRLWSPDHASERQYVIQVGSTERSAAELLAWAEAWRQQRAAKTDEEPIDAERLGYAVRADDRRMWGDLRQIIEETPVADRPGPTAPYAGARPGEAEAPAPPGGAPVAMYATDAGGATWRERQVAEAEARFAQYAAEFPPDASEEAALPHGYDAAADARVREQVLAMRAGGGVTAWPESKATWERIPASADLRNPEVFRTRVEELLGWYREKGVPMPRLERLEIKEKRKVPGIHRPSEEEEQQQQQQQQPDGQQPSNQQQPDVQQPDVQQPNVQQSDGQVHTSQQLDDQIPTSEYPTGRQPTSQQPTSQQPTPQQPSSQQPNDEVPTSQNPTGQQPVVGPVINEPQEPGKIIYPKPGFGAPPVVF